MTKQIETATVIGSIVNPGNATVVVTGARIPNSPKTFNVAVLALDSANTVALDIRSALALDSDVSGIFQVSGSGANIVLTSRADAANDTTLNISIANGTCTGLTAAPTSTDTLAGDGLSNAYCDLATLKSKGLLNFTDAGYDVVLEKIVNGVSRRIEERCHRFFYQTVLQQRFYQAFEYRTLWVDDIATATGLIVQIDVNGDGVVDFTLTTSDYIPAPYNALTKGWPYTSLETTSVGNYRFPIMVRKGCWITAVFGWPAVPSAVEDACLLQSMRFFKRFSTPLGASAMTAFGPLTLKIPNLDPDVADMLETYRHIQDVNS